MMSHLLLALFLVPAVADDDCTQAYNYFYCDYNTVMYGSDCKYSTDGGATEYDIAVCDGADPGDYFYADCGCTYEDCSDDDDDDDDDDCTMAYNWFYCEGDTVMYGSDCTSCDSCTPSSVLSDSYGYTCDSSAGTYSAPGVDGYCIT
ncbi:hypothetical protein AURANDRAFT_63730, partial [Aureococcus anophagefferens]